MALQGVIDLGQFRAQDWGSTKQYRYGYYRGPKSYSNWFANHGTGDPAVPGDFQLGQIHVLSIELASNTAGATLVPAHRLSIHGGPPNDGILWFDIKQGQEIANGTDLSDYVAVFTCVGL